MVATLDTLTCRSPHRSQLCNRRLQASFHRSGQRIAIASGHKPAVDAGFHQFRDAGNECADDRTTERHRLHEYDGKPFGEAWQYQRTSCGYFLPDVVIAKPARDADLSLQPEARDDCLDLWAH